jgi:hypothetical protein
LLVDDAVLPDGGGFVAVYRDGGGAPGEQVAASQHLDAGPHADVRLELDPSLDDAGPVWLMAHADEGSASFEADGDEPVTTDGAVVVVRVELTLDES